MPELPRLGKGGMSRSALRDYHDNRMMVALATKPRLAAAMDNRRTRWLKDVDALPEEPQDLARPVNYNTANAAFVARRNQNAQRLEDALERCQRAFEAGTQPGKKTMKALRKAEADVHQDVSDWDANQQRYERDLSTYDERNAEHREAAREALADLKGRLFELVQTYNRSYLFEEPLTEDWCLRYFLNPDYCLNWIPTQHRWFPDVGAHTDKYTKVTSTGTYIYDFGDNVFQLHLHCSTYDGDVETIRVKPYGQQTGWKTNSKSDIAVVSRLFRDRYPPQPGNFWTQV